MPISHIVHLNARDYSTFMKSIYSWLPFECDEQTADRPRKWLTNKPLGPITHKVNEGELLDALRFIPKTDKAIKERNFIEETQSMKPLETWFYRNAASGNRNSTLLRYGYALMDNGKPAEDALLNVYAFNAKLPEPLKEEEILHTIGRSLTKKENKK